MAIPDFIGIGAQRAGTTWIHHALSEHPEIWTAKPKELHFFDLNWDQGVDWYKRQFEGAPKDALRGEFTPDYLADPDAITRLAKTAPEAKLITVLRDPVDRAYSAYWLFQDRYEDISFEAALRRDSKLLKMGIYADQLEHILANFPEEQLLILFYTDLADDDVGTAQTIYRFLDVDERFRPEVAGRSHNAVIFPRLQTLLRKSRLLWIKDLIKGVGLDAPIRRFHRRGGGYYPPMDSETRRRLEAYFEPHDHSLAQLLGRDIPWRDLNLQTSSPPLSNR